MMSIFHQLTNEEYHRGEEWGPMLNASAVKVLIGETPAHFKYFRDHPVATTKDMKIGTAVHTAILEPEKFESQVVAVPKMDKRTIIGKDADAQFQLDHAGKLQLSEKDFALVRSMADSVEASEDARNLLLGMPIREQSIKWKDETFGCWCKARPDMLRFKDQAGGINAIGDLKTTKKNAKTFRFQAQDYGYFVQAGWYRRGMKKLTGEEWKFLLLAVEKAPPHCVSFHVVNDYSDALIDDAIEKAGRIFKECSAVDVWPGWSAEVNEIGMTDAGENSILNYMEEK